jgi:surface polysaccharide O-acyltransferase-like enzyme
VLGYYLGSKGPAGIEAGGLPWRFSEKQLALIGMASIVAGTASTMLGTYWLNSGWTPGANFDVYFYDYLTPNVGFSAIGWFLLIRFGWSAAPLHEVEKDFSCGCFGIYLVTYW